MLNVHPPFIPLWRREKEDGLLFELAGILFVFYNAPTMGTFTSIHDLIEDYSRGQPLGQKLLVLRLKEHWPSIVGQTIAKHSSPDSVRFHKLYLVVENSVWLQQLVFLKSTILETLHRLIPELLLTDIVLRLGTLPLPHIRREEKPDSFPVPSPEEAAFARQMAQRLADPELREALGRTMAKGLSEPLRGEK